MARILCYDSDAVLGSDGAGLTGGHGTKAGVSISVNIQAPDHTLPVRIFGGEQESRYVGWEFLMENFTAGAGDIVEVSWWMEFFGDAPSLNTPPRARTWPGVPPTASWATETLVVNVGLGTVNMFPVIRQMNMQPRLEQAAAGTTDCLSATLSVHGYWVRLGLYVDLTACTNVITAALLAGRRLKIFAHVGGHMEDQFTQDTGALPYVYNAYK